MDAQELQRMFGDRFVSVKEAELAWGEVLPEHGEIVIPEIAFQKTKELSQLMTDSKRGMADGWLVPYFGSKPSWLGQVGTSGVEAGHQLFSDLGWLGSGSFFLEFAVPAIYVAIDMAPGWPGKNGSLQRELAGKSGLLPAADPIVLEALFTIFLTRKKQLLRNRFHLGAVYGDKRVVIGWGMKGIEVSFVPQNISDSNWGLCTDVF